MSAVLTGETKPNELHGKEELEQRHHSEMQ